MPLLRLAIIAAGLWLAIGIVRRIMRAGAAPKTDLSYGGKMVNCEVCGVYLPEREAISVGDGKFRCDKH